MSYVFDSLEVKGLIFGKSNPIRQKIRVASTDHVDINNCQVIDDIKLELNDRVLLKNQENKIENGVYKVNENYQLTRTDDFDTGDSCNSHLLVIEDGTKNGTSTFMSTNMKGNDIIGTHELSFVKNVQTNEESPQDGNLVIWKNGKISDSKEKLSTIVSILNNLVTINHIVIKTVSYFNYDDSFYRDHPTPNPVCSFYVDASYPCYFDLYDGTNVIGSTTTTSVGTHQFEFTKPTSNKLLQLRAKLDSNNRNVVGIYSVQLKF